MTSLVAWAGVDQRRQSSLNIATDSRISWSIDAKRSQHWDQGQKVFASSEQPLVVGFVGDVLFPLLAIPHLIDRIDRGIFRTDGCVVEGVVEGVRRLSREYPLPRAGTLYVATRVGTGMKSSFRLTVLKYSGAGEGTWTTTDLAMPSTSECLVIDGSGAPMVREALATWQRASDRWTSRAISAGFVDAVLTGKDPRSGGAPQIGALYQIGNGRLIGTIHEGQRYFAGGHLIGDEQVDGVEWRNALSERTDGRTKRLLPGAQPQPRPPIVDSSPRSV